MEVEKSQLLVFCDLPLPQFVVEILLRVLGYNVKSIRGGMPTKKRTLVAREFNKPKSEIQVLVVTYYSCSVGQSVQKNCHNVVLLEPALSLNSTLQAIGRMHRLGQSKRQRVWILSGANTFDRYIEYKQSEKFLDRLVGQGHAVFKELNRDQDGTTASDESESKSGVKEAIIERADEIIQQMFGQPESRRSFGGDWRDIGLSQKECARLKTKWEQQQATCSSSAASLSQESSRSSTGTDTEAQTENVNASETSGGQTDDLSREDEDIDDGNTEEASHDQVCSCVYSHCDSLL